jgi:hypothetical protein
MKRKSAFRRRVNQVENAQQLLKELSKNSFALRSMLMQDSEALGLVERLVAKLQERNNPTQQNENETLSLMGE